MLPVLGQPVEETLRIQTMGEPTVDLTGYEQQQQTWLMYRVGCFWPLNTVNNERPQTVSDVLEDRKRKIGTNFRV